MKKQEYGEHEEQRFQALIDKAVRILVNGLSRDEFEELAEMIDSTAGDVLLDGMNKILIEKAPEVFDAERIYPEMTFFVQGRSDCRDEDYVVLSKFDQPTPDGGEEWLCRPVKAGHERSFRGYEISNFRQEAAFAATHKKSV